MAELEMKKEIEHLKAVRDGYHRALSEYAQRDHEWRRDVVRLLCILARSNMDRFQADEHVREIERRWFND